MKIKKTLRRRDSLERVRQANRYETDLMKRFPIQATREWFGNTPSVAMKRYAQVLESDFTRAINGPAKGGATPCDLRLSGKHRNAANPEIRGE